MAEELDIKCDIADVRGLTYNSERSYYSVPLTTLLRRFQLKISLKV